MNNFQRYKIYSLEAEVFYALKDPIPHNDWEILLVTNPFLHSFNDVVHVVNISESLQSPFVEGFTFSYPFYNEAVNNLVDLDKFKHNMSKSLKTLNSLTVTDVQFTIIFQGEIKHDKVKISGVDGGVVLVSKAMEVYPLIDEVLS